MTESLSIYDISQTAYTDLQSILRRYQDNSIKTSVEENDKEIKKFADRRDLVKYVRSEVQKMVDERNQAIQNRRADEAKKQQQTNTRVQDDKQTFELPEVKTYSLPKNTQTIVSELRRNGLRHTLTAYGISEQYGVSYMQARDILDELNTDSNGFVREFNLPQYSTISYKVN